MNKKKNIKLAPKKNLRKKDCKQLYLKKELQIIKREKHFVLEKKATPEKMKVEKTN